MANYVIDHFRIIIFMWPMRRLDGQGGPSLFLSGGGGGDFFFGSLCYYSQCVPTWFPLSSHNVLQDVPTSSTLLSHILWPKIELFTYISQRPKGGISSASIGGVLNVFY
jgi:hypothetical protein